MGRTLGERPRTHELEGEGKQTKRGRREVMYLSALRGWGPQPSVRLPSEALDKGRILSLSGHGSPGRSLKWLLPAHSLGAGGGGGQV